MVSSEMQYDIARVPIDTAKGLGKAVEWPVHFGLTLATNVVDTAFKVAGVSTEDKAYGTTPPEKGTSVYEVARNNMDIAAMIYYYTELRSEVKKLLRQKLAEYPEIKSFDEDMPVLRDAYREVRKNHAALRSDEQPPPKPEEESAAAALGDSAAVVKNYRESLSKFAGLCDRYGIFEGDREVLETYFHILEEPKDMECVYGDLVKYDQYIDPQFRLAFGGSAKNRKCVKDMVTENGEGDDVYIHHIDDDFTTSSLDLDGIIGGFSETEMVWAIVVNRKKKTFTVVFRGSTNATDWIRDLSVNMADCVLPGYTTDAAPVEKHGKSYGRVHCGFYKYLFDKTHAGRNGSTKSKGEEIVGMLRGLLARPEHAGYSVVITGHSLGGSLSTLFAYRCALFDDFDDTTVTNVSFASPYVGDADFRDNFVELERKCKIKHLRMANYQDVVTISPFSTLPFPPNFLEAYKHVGMCIRMYEGGDLGAPSYRRFYPKKDDNLNGVRNALHANVFPLGFTLAALIGNHLLPEYDARLTNEETEKELRKFTLDQLYDDEDVTGWKYLALKKISLESGAP
mmetsp:Transcript_21041/g.49894  ORF Transcript_21041/g.49894 Transcript_21041/m.49894 type:complete len:567 (+) Transcript_21041:118-1818(+)